MADVRLVSAAGAAACRPAEIVLAPAAAAEGWVRHIAEEPHRFLSDCLFATATFEFDALTGVVHDEVVEGTTRWRARLAEAAREVADLGDLPARAEPDQLAFDLIG
ncbi:TetR family transcriptional regulator C-terminal domain-containing protein [Amycolatopsis sp. NPDC004368]